MAWPSPLRASCPAGLEGLRPVGSLGVLARAHRAGVLMTKGAWGEALKPLLSASLWVGPDVIEAFWEGVGGRG